MKKSHLLEIAFCACCIFASCKETEIFIQPHELHLNVGDNTTITAIVDHGDPADIMWSSPFPSYVSVERSNNAGEAVVTAKMYTPDPITITASIPTESAKADCIVIVDQAASDDTTHTGNDPITITPPLCHYTMATMRPYTSQAKDIYPHLLEMNTLQRRSPTTTVLRTGKL